MVDSTVYYSEHSLISRTIRVPVHMVETIAKYKQVVRRLFQDLGRATSEEIATEMGLDVDKIYTIRKIDQTHSIA